MMAERKWRRVVILSPLVFDKLEEAMLPEERFGEVEDGHLHLILLTPAGKLLLFKRGTT